MLVRPAPFIDAMARKLGQSVVYYQTFGRQFSRQWILPHNPDSTNQSLVRSYFTNGSQGWGLLSGSDRNDWNNVASLTTLIDSLGRPYTPTGKGLYTAAAVYAQINADTPLDTPDTQAAPPIPVIASATVAGGNLTIALTKTASAGNGWYYVKTSAPLFADARVARLTDLRSETTVLANSITQDSVGTSQSIVRAVSALWASVNSGDRIGIQIITLNPAYQFGGQIFNTNILIA